jgi:uncharacterized damage-inducible protein DinB
MTNSLLNQFRTLVRYNTLANLTLYEACSHLPEMEYKKGREACCDSIMGTITHPMVGDRIWSGEQTYASAEGASRSYGMCVNSSATVGTEPAGI